MCYKKDRSFTPLETVGRRQKANVSLMGFTLVEMLIVIIIIGILAALTLPQFGKPKEHAIGKEAIANLKLIAAAEKIYRMKLNAYYPIPAGSQSDITNINNYLKLSLTEANWDYAVRSDLPASGFTSTARRLSGAYSGCIWTVDNAADEPTTTNCP